MSLRSKVNHITITLLPKWHLGSISIFILHTFSTLYLFSPLGYNLGQNILSSSDNDDFTVSLQKSNNFSVDTTSYWKNTWHACKPIWCLWLLHTICAETHHIITNYFPRIFWIRKDTEFGHNTERARKPTFRWACELTHIFKII